jgi:hypothetical protein
VIILIIILEKTMFQKGSNEKLSLVRSKLDSKQILLTEKSKTLTLPLKDVADWLEWENFSTAFLLDGMPGLPIYTRWATGIGRRLNGTSTSNVNS